MTLTFIQGHRVRKIWNLYNSSIMKWHEVTKTFVIADYAREMTAMSVNFMCLMFKLYSGDSKPELFILTYCLL